MNLNSLKNKNVIYFTAPWCKISNMNSNFEKLKVEFPKITFLKLEADLPENKNIKDYFKVVIIPSILVTSGQQELFRIEGKSLIKPLRSSLKKICLL